MPHCRQPPRGRTASNRDPRLREQNWLCVSGLGIVSAATLSIVVEDRLMTPRTRWPLPLTACFLCLSVTAGRAADYCVTCSNPDQTYLCQSHNSLGVIAGSGGQLSCITVLAKRGGHDSCSVARGASADCDGLVPTVLYPGTGPETSRETSRETRPGTRPETIQDLPADVSADQVTPFSPAITPEAATGPAGTATSATETFEADAAQSSAEEAEQGSPKTVEEMASRSYKASKKGLSNAGKSISKGAKVTGKAVSNTAKKAGTQIGKAGKAVGSAAKKTWNCLTSLFSDC